MLINNKMIIKKPLSFFYDLSRSFVLKKKIKKIYKISPGTISLSHEKKAIHLKLWSALGKKPDLKWMQVYTSINNIEDPAYITEIDYYTRVEPTLNNRTFSEAYCDKNFYHRIIDKNLLPSVYLRNIEKVFYDENYKIVNRSTDLNAFFPPDVNSIVVKKAVDSGGGRGVELFTRQGKRWVDNSGIELTYNNLNINLNKNFLIQEYIDQHDYFRQFNGSSVNTVRILTYRSVKTQQIIILQAVLRIGKPGSFVDNQASGGISCGIDEIGNLNNFAVNKLGEKFMSINSISFKEFEPVIMFQEIQNIAKSIAPKFNYQRLLGFDFCVDKENKVRLIEVNNRNNEINFYQMNNGPLFKEYTNEIIEFCLSNSKSICFDFEV